MAIPIIDNTQSVLGYKARETFSFMAGGSGSPEILYWTASSLPSGLTIDAPAEKSCIGEADDNLLTCEAHEFSNGDKVYFQSITGGTGLAALTVYYVRDKTADTFSLAATLTGAAVDFSADISAGHIRKCGTSRITGSVSTPGVYVIGLNAVNATGASSSSSTVTGVPTYFTLGIEAVNGGVPVAGSDDTGIDLDIDVATRTVTASAAAAAATGPLFILKEEDVAILNIRFKKAGIACDPNPNHIRVAFKELETEAVLFEAGGDIADDAWEKNGDGAAAFCKVPVAVTGVALASALGNYEDDAGTKFDALCEIEWRQALSPAIGGIAELVSSSRTFLVTIERDLVV